MKTKETSMGKCNKCGAIQYASYLTCRYNGVCNGKVIPDAYLKTNQKQFKQFDESLHKAYLNKFSDEDKFKAFISNLNELSEKVQFNAFLATLRKMKLDSRTESNIMTLVALKDI